MNIANKLSMFRIFLIPVLVVIYLFPYADFHISLGSVQILGNTILLKDIYCLLIFAIASFTDFLDGYIARKYNLITTFGKFIDPIADKLLVNTSFIMLAASGIVPLVAVLIMIARDTIVDAMRMITADKGVVVAAGIFGKLKTVFQMVAIIFAYMHGLQLSILGVELHVILVWLATLTSIYSGIVYFKEMKPYIMESK